MGFSSGTWEPGSQDIFSLTGNLGGNSTLFKENIDLNSRTFERNYELINHGNSPTKVKPSYALNTYIR